MARMPVHITDGGRRAAGFTGSAGDCVTRAVAIATGQPYAEVYRVVASGTGAQRATKGRRRPITAREGIHTGRKWFKDYMRSLGWRWVPTMGIGTGCTVHLAAGELPSGRLVVSVSRHYTVVIDGVIHDTHDPQRDGEVVFGGTPVRDADGRLRNPVVSVGGGRCVYGYWHKEER